MGGFCSCFHVPDEQPNNGSNNSTSDECSCPKCFFKKFINKQGNIFRRGQTHAVSLPNQQASSSNSRLVLNNPSYASGPHDGAVANTASFRQWNRPMGRQEKGTRLSRVQPVPVGQNDIQVNPKPMQGDRILISTSEFGFQEQNFGSSAKGLSSGIDGIAYTFPSLDDEDECPTCLEEYTEENPKLIAKCSHHYHLSCIYEWMERSKNCPVCGKLMEFDELI